MINISREGLTDEQLNEVRGGLDQNKYHQVKRGDVFINKNNQKALRIISKNATYGIDTNIKFYEAINSFDDYIEIDTIEKQMSFAALENNFLYSSKYHYDF